MESTVREKNQKNPERKITVGEEFYPFDPENTRVNVGHGFAEREVTSLHSDISLTIGNLSLPLKIYTAHSKTEKIRAITPFDPNHGYTITNEDLDLKSRIKKTNELLRELVLVDPNKEPVYVAVEAHENELNKAGLNMIRYEPFHSYEFPQYLLETLRRLRLRIFFPEQQYEGKITEASLSLGSVRFAHFYPFDTGPLPHDYYHDHYIHEGFSLFLPDDPEKLAQIRMRFALAPSGGGES